MTPADFIAWQSRLGLTIDQAGRVLGVARRTVTAYRTRPGPLPFTVELACRYLEANPGLVRDLAPELCQHRAP